MIASVSPAPASNVDLDPPKHKYSCSDFISFGDGRMHCNDTWKSKADWRSPYDRTRKSRIGHHSETCCGSTGTRKIMIPLPSRNIRDLQELLQEWSEGRHNLWMVALCNFGRPAKPVREPCRHHATFYHNRSINDYSLCLPINFALDMDTSLSTNQP